MEMVPDGSHNSERSMDLPADLIEITGGLTYSPLDTLGFIGTVPLQDQHFNPWDLPLDTQHQENQAASAYGDSRAGYADSPLQANPRNLSYLSCPAGEQSNSDIPTVGRGLFNMDLAAAPGGENSSQDFLRGLHGAFRPTMSCSYCRYHRLECLIIRTTSVNPNPILACSSCVALFRECSLAIGEKRRPAKFETTEPILGHLHGVNEEDQDGFDLINWEDDVDGSHQVLESASTTLPEASSSSAIPGKAKRAISKQDTRVLKAWLFEHRGYPYPTEDEKLELRASTGLTVLQISNWFANSRRRKRYPRNVPIPTGDQNSKQNSESQELLSQSPMQRWKNSPPEDDPINPSILAEAIVSTSKVNYQHLRSGTVNNEDGHLYQQYSPFDSHSVSSLDTSQSGFSSDSSASAWSHGSHASHNSYSSITRPKRRRHQKRKQFERAGIITSTAVYHCTFCPDSFKKKHDWQRHEQSIHLPLEHWVCSSGSGITILPDSSFPQCIFCGTSNPTEAHLNAHEFNTCSDRPESERTFRRKDHLRQHLIKFHGCPKPLDYVIEAWKKGSWSMRSRCGFCDACFGNWDDRAAHVATHFKDGAVMDDWAGNWGLDDDILALLRSAVLPGSAEWRIASRACHMTDLLLDGPGLGDFASACARR